MSPTFVCVNRVGNIRLSMQVKNTALGYLKLGPHYFIFNMNIIHIFNRNIKSDLYFQVDNQWIPQDDL